MPITYNATTICGACHNIFQRELLYVARFDKIMPETFVCPKCRSDDIRDLQMKDTAGNILFFDYNGQMLITTAGLAAMA